MKPKHATTAQAELLLHLYELRREPVMREARSYIGGRFAPASADEIVALITSGSREGSFILQVFGYWDMVAAFVLHDVLPASLVYDTCQEMYFQYSKLQPHLPDVRRQMNLPEWMCSIEAVVEGSKSGRKRIATMQQGAGPPESISNPAPRKASRK